ncbi:MULTISPECIES: 4-hydroxy-tetrahydrodipicolinate reductase [Delftia]|uniref:4-hydroxy-tetrahydrodipicolinate reductase n=1 Tax=Delftia TaxID=80865 RepID=UPI00064067E3|nr:MULTISPECIES: 4-hydroxy-tetrahydrodipicolinate reductase [Delftia]MCO5336615.1 4-hydroxy-tetrahydrodipicolinate reductase [Delftia tsuruhatensis]MCR4545317.1 4-hydroxy-tetrahydrodipicolinate reductase [Delftia tsuruhatensis]
MNATTATSSSNNQRLRVAVAGASGRMGRMLIEAIAQSDDLALTAALDRPDSPALGTDPSAFLGLASGIVIESDVRVALSKADCLIDFTRPEGTLEHLAICAELGVRLVIGTTGFSDEQKARIAEYAQRTAVVLSPNMSVGVNVTFKLLEMAAKALSSGYDIEIVEAHHRHKVDAPSGTALKMGEVIAEAQGTKLADRAVYERFGHTGAREDNTIGFATVRGGDIIGDHTVLFAGTGERIEISHKSSSRAGYAQGSLRAARFLAGKTSGQYDMYAVLGL